MGESPIESESKSPTLRSSHSDGEALEHQFESQAEAQLRRGFPWLKFRGPLEGEFRSAYRDQIKNQLRFNLWLTFSLVAALLIAGGLALGTELNARLNAIRAGVVLPTLGLALGMTYSRFYAKYFSPLIQIVAPLFGIGIVIESFIAAPFNMSIFPAVVLMVMGIYLFVGMLFFAALRSALVILAAYAVGAMVMNAPPEQTAYNMILLFCTNLVGATVCYALEKVHRTNYLEARLLTEMACRDGLTGIYNRRMFDEHLDKVWQQAGRERIPVALLLVDIDHFKNYNDYYGHQAGDECLKHVAKALSFCARRPLDFTARYGGEEFAIVLYNARRDYVEEVSRRIQASMERLALKHPISPVSQHLTVSIGAACIIPVPERSHFGFIQLADEALYDAKGSGRNRCIVMDKEYEDLSTGSFRARSTAVAQ